MAYTDIDDPTAYFQTKIYTGDGNDNRSITFDGNSNLAVNFLWFKNRGATAWHNLYDSVRGANKALASNATNAEESRSDTLDSFNSNGFTVGNDTSQNPDGLNTNANGNTYVTWGWKAGTSFTNDASATGIGTIDSTGSVSQEAGFSIISYTGNGTANQSVAHGLGATPKFIIIKPRSASGYWCVTNPRFVSVSDPNILYLQLSNGGEADDTNINGTTAPSSTVFGVDDYNAVNVNGQTQIAYCFTPIKNYSSMSTYVGNGNANGTFVYTGFKPAFILRRRADGAGSWLIQDNKRDGINRAVTNSLPTDQNVLRANDSSAEEFNNELDILSNGFKLRATDAFGNASGGTYIYMAFAENPFVTSTGVPATAR